MVDGRYGATLWGRVVPCPLPRPLCPGVADELIIRYLRQSDVNAATRYCHPCLIGVHFEGTHDGRSTAPTAAGTDRCTCRGECVGQGGYRTIVDPVQADGPPARRKKRRR